MRYALTMALLSLIGVLQASANYPALFSNQGTPLYESAKNIEGFKKFEVLKIQTTQYVKKLNLTKEIGFRADVSDEKKDKLEYLKSLRSLQESHDKILQSSIKELNFYIYTDDYRNFLEIVNVGMSYYEKKSILEQKILAFYKNNRSKGESRTLNKIIKENKSVTTRYFSAEDYVAKEETSVAQEKTSVKKKSVSKEIILLSRPGCSFCVKAKRFLDARGSEYREYNVNSGKGKTLFKQNGGRGVPIVIIDGKVIKGYSTQAMIAALK